MKSEKLTLEELGKQYYSLGGIIVPRPESIPCQGKEISKSNSKLDIIGKKYISLCGLLIPRPDWLPIRKKENY